MRRVVAVLGAAALVALVLVLGREGGRSSPRSVRGEGGQVAAAADEADGAAAGDAATGPAASSDESAQLPPGRIELLLLDVDSHQPVPDLEVGLGERFRRTNEDGAAVWEDTVPGRLEVRTPELRYRLVADQPDGLLAEFARRRLTVLVERLTTLRLRFEHDDGTPVGEVASRVTGGDEISIPGEEPAAHWSVRTGSAVSVWAFCEDGYEAETEVLCDAWPMDERTIYLRPTVPRGRTRLTFEVVAEETGEPIAFARAGYHYMYGVDDRGRWMHRWWEGRTDENGICVLEDLPTAGGGRASAWARGRCYHDEATKLEPGSPRLLRFALAKRLGLAIRVTCPDRPAATVTLTGEGYERRAELKDSAFVFGDLDPGEYTLKATDGDDTLSVAVVAGGPPVRLSFPPRGALVLDCRDALGQVPESIEVVVEREGVRGNCNRLTPEKGRFRLPVSQGAVTISVEARGYRTAVVPVHVVGDAVNEATVPLGDALPILDVQVVDPSGAPVPGVSVWLRLANAGFEFYDDPHNPAETSLDGWARFVRSDAPAEYRVSAGIVAAIGDPPEPSGQSVRVPTTGRVATTLVAVPLPRVGAKPAGEPLPGGLLLDDLLVEWGGHRLRLDEEVPTRWTEPVAIRVLRDGKEIELTLPPMTREFLVHQALLPPPKR